MFFKAIRIIDESAEVIPNGRILEEDLWSISNEVVCPI